MPKDWGFHNDFEMVVAGYDLWEARDFERMPTRNEIADIDPEWREDLFLFRRLVKMQRQKDITTPPDAVDTSPIIKGLPKVKRRPGSQ